MLTFKQFINLFEAKLDDIKRGIANRHKKETGEDLDPNELHDVVTRAKKIPGVDLTKSSFKELKDKVEPGIKEIYHNPKTGVTINHVTKKDSCVKEYGHGKTNWCVSATGRGNLFNEYGKRGKKFFTIHHKNPETGEEKIYGAHEIEEGVIRNTENESVKPPDDVYKEMAKTPELNKFNMLSQNPHITKEHITKALGDDHYDVREAAIRHPKATPEHITKALDDESEKVREAAIRHPNATPEHITKALGDNEPRVRDAAIQHPNATPEHITKALDDNKYRVRWSAIQHPNATPEHITKALDDNDYDVRLAAKKALMTLNKKGK